MTEPHLQLSVCLITLNEADRLEPCLKSLPPNCEIIIVDSGSTDGTQALAKKYGAKIFEETFINYAAQKNSAIDRATRTWVLCLDADEVLSVELRREVETIVSSKDPTTAFAITRALVFQGKKLRFGGTHDEILRLFPKGTCRYEGKIHERLIPSIKVEKLRGEILHRSYRNLDDYFKKFNRYTSLMAEEKDSAGTKKPLWFLIFLRAEWEYFRRVILQGAFLDGYPGILNAALASFYVMVKYAKRREL